MKRSNKKLTSPIINISSRGLFVKLIKHTNMKQLIFLQCGGCQLIKTKSPFKGFYNWDMVSPNTGKHSLHEKTFNKRVRTHWEGFLSSQLLISLRSK